MAGITVLFGVLGATGYTSCFPDCQDSILLNLPGTWYELIVVYTYACFKHLFNLLQKRFFLTCMKAAYLLS